MKKRSQCKNGHPYVEGSFTIRDGGRICRACRKMHRQAFQLKERERRKAEGTYLPRTGERTHCARGHEFSVENTLFCNVGNNGRKRICLTCRVEWSKACSRKKSISETTARLVQEAILSGHNFAEITGESLKGKPIPRICSSSPLFYFRKANPEIDAKWRGMMAKLHKPKSVRLIAAPAILKNNGFDAFEAIQSATRHLIEPLRGTVQSDMWLDVTEGRLMIRQIGSRLQDYIRKYNRDERHSVANRWGHRSLDAPMGDGGFTLLDTLEDGAGWTVPISTGNRVGIRRSG